MESIPSRVPHVLPAGRSLTGTDSPEVPRPSDDTSASPTCAGPSGSDTVPLPGYLSPSAVSWQALAHDPLGPQPSMGSSPAEPSPRGDRAPLSRPLAPLQSVTDLHERDTRALSPPVSPTPTSLLLSRGLAPQSPGSPVGYGQPFHAARARPFGRSPPRFPVAPGPRTGIARPGQLHLLRSLDPSVESVHAPVGLPILRGRCSPGVRPSRAFLRPGPGPYLTRASPPVGKDAQALAC